MKPPNKIKPPYNATDIRPAPNAEVGGRNMVPILEANTTPKPIANGPPMYKNFSLGAQRATVDSPPTIPVEE